MERPEVLESPRKRQKTEDVPATEIAAVAPATDADEDAQAAKEREVGITELVTANLEGFSGILKKRQARALITPSGEVLHLRNLEAPHSQKTEAPPNESQHEGAQGEDKKEATKDGEVAPVEISGEDNALLEELFGADNAPAIVELHKRAMSTPKAKPSELGKVSNVVKDRDQRIKIHQSIRRIFKSQLESTADGDGNLSITAASNRFKRNPQGGRGGGGRGGGGRIDWNELGGQYLHFTIYKENKDTMEVTSFLARQLKMQPKSFQFAGTKDRRGVTTQRACVFRVHADRLAKLNPTLRNAALGDFEYRKEGLELGDLYGNEFVITLRDCKFPGMDLQDPQGTLAKASELVGSSLKNLHERGYFNYFGLQRFGTFSTRTDTIGVQMLQGDFEGACNSILDFNPDTLAAAQEGENSTALIGSDDKSRAEAINIFRTTGRVNEALEKLPRKFSAETSIIRHLGRAKHDFFGALQSIPRNLRLMYVHAYQSLVFNYAASERWRLYGDKVVEGDLVIVQEHRDKEVRKQEDVKPVGPDTVDEDGEIVVVPEGSNSATAAEDMITRARALTAEEVASGQYTIFDVVLPMVGFDVIYPPNKMTDFFRDFMASEKGGGLDPFNMRRKQKDISLTGGYRKVFSRMGPDYSFEVKLYSEEDQQFVQTDLAKLKQDSTASSVPDSFTGDKLAVILKFQLGSSQYATMALRELLKGKVKEYKAEFSAAR
ncbi:hypothetical protein N7468_007702 [Penicillium chermesinum]|uniref:TRUD domain-containing protein n=1 Tax=Penicillium chermesinum TaxID=63820 RepID=A0A9W9NUV5_9EURO|nr:uncharacterized protein N7468_007702 [Penicillium chermesinum]KAJ5226477.1 hypothetical protein N7468_007702 [Penicillium chermesinum]